MTTSRLKTYIKIIVCNVWVIKTQETNSFPILNLSCQLKFKQCQATISTFFSKGLTLTDLHSMFMDLEKKCESLETKNKELEGKNVELERKVNSTCKRKKDM